MKQKTFFIAIMLILCVNIGYTQMTAKEAKQQKKELKAQEIKQLVQSKHFIFKANALTTTGGFYKNLTSEYDLIINTDSISIDLPYWGRVYMTRIDDIGGFHFKEKVNELDIQDRGKKGYQLTFTLDNKGDNYFFSMDISRLGYANLRISSTRRSLITYDGVIESATAD